MNGTRAFIAVVAVFIAVLVLIWRSNHHGGRRVIGRRVPFAELIAPDPEARPPDELQREQVPDPEPHRAATHLLPSEGDGEYLTSCCGRSPFDLNASREQLVIRQEQVTCPGGESR